ncbi:MAG: hypothetical protein ABI136_02985 [Ginsengibacter sp.]
MENYEIKMSERESLALITMMINKAKGRVNETGTLYLLWGWLILVCCIVQFIGSYFLNYANSYYIWFSTWLLLIYQFFYIGRRKKIHKTKTYMGEINGFVWLVFFISMMLVIFIGSYLKKYEIINPLLLMLYGMPTFLSGIILKFKPLIVGGISCWILSVISVFIYVDFQLMLIAIAVISGWIIPGYILKQNFKKETQKNGVLN